MVLIIDPRLSKASCGITVLAAEQAGIVHADILTGDAATGFALVGVFLSRDRQVEHLPDQLVVNTFARMNTIRTQIQGLGATLNLHAVLAGYFCHGSQQIAQARPALLPGVSDREALFG